jgi:hypothetical protein
MALGSTAAAISIQDGAGAVVNLANGAVGQFTPGANLTISLQSTAGVGKWSLQFEAPMYPALHQRTFDWLPGQVNAWVVPMPSGPVSPLQVLAGIELISVVSDASGGAIPQSINFLQSKGANSIGLQHVADYVIVAALPAYTNVNGVLTGNANGAVTSTMADGATPAVGDLFLLEQGLAGSAADAGLYQLTAVGSAGAKFVATLAQDWQLGNILLPGTEIHVGYRGTVFKGTTWVNTLTGLTNVIGTAAFTYFPRIVTYTSALVAGIQTAGAGATASAPAVMSVMSTSLTNVLTQRRTPNTASTTIMYCKNTAGMAAGGLGTGAASVFATVAAGTIQNTDVSTMDTTVFNPC